MNQILSNKLYNVTKKNRILKKLTILFVASSLIIIFLVSYNIYNNIKYEKEKQYSINFSKRYQVYKLFLNYNLNQNQFSESDILGTIIIPKLSISYPFFYGINTELLKISPCKFNGNMPDQNNKQNNLCIAGHNYGNNKFFSNISKLEKNDLIQIENLKKNVFNYYVYDSFEINENEISKVINSSYYFNTLTLLTCNNFNNKRIIVKAKLTNKFK